MHNARPEPDRAEDGHRHRQDRRDGDAHRLADAEQGGQPERCPLRQAVLDRDSGPDDPGPAAGAAARARGELLQAARPGSRRPEGGPGPGEDRDHELPCACSAGRPSRAGRRRRLPRSCWPGYSGAPSPFLESWGQMVSRVCRDLGGTSGIVVFNDEAHHCYLDRYDNPEDEGDHRQGPHRRREGRGAGRTPRRPGSGSTACARSRRSSASRRSTTCPPPRPSCPAPAIGRGRCSPGWSPTSAWSRRSSPAS